MRERRERVQVSYSTALQYCQVRQNWVVKVVVKAVPIFMYKSMCCCATAYTCISVCCAG